MFVKISLLALALSYAFVAGDVDESSPDLSRYNLRNDNDERQYPISLDRGSEESQKQDGPEDRPDENEFTESHLFVLHLVKMKISSFGLHKDADGKSTPVPISSLIDFDSNWRLLQKAKLNPKSELGVEALKFRTQKTNIDIARRVEKSISTYHKIIDFYTGILESQNSGQSKNLAMSFWNLETLLNEIDPMVDVSNIRKVVNEYKNKDHNLNSWNR